MRAGVIAIAAGCVHTMVVKFDGTVWGTGYNPDGRLGDGTNEGIRAAFTEAIGISGQRGIMDAFS